MITARKYFSEIAVNIFLNLPGFTSEEIIILCIENLTFINVKLNRETKWNVDVHF